MTDRKVVWLIERKGMHTGKPIWYAENETGWHWWTHTATEAKPFASKAEAEAFPAYQMIATDPAISVTEHVFLPAASPPPVAEGEAQPVAWQKLREAYEAAKYVPGDHPVVPVKIAAFMREVERIFATPRPAVSEAMVEALPVAWQYRYRMWNTGEWSAWSVPTLDKSDNNPDWEWRPLVATDSLASPPPVAEGEAQPVAPCKHNSDWLETFAHVTEGRLEDELASALGVVSTELAPYSFEELLDIVRERTAALSSVPGKESPAPAVGEAVARPEEGWHEDYGDVVWWTWKGDEWLGEPSYIGSPLIERLRGACVGHPHAKIAWPHHLLHEAADHIATLEAALEEAKKALEPFAKSAAMYEPQEYDDDDMAWLSKFTLGQLRRAARAASGAI